MKIRHRMGLCQPVPMTRVFSHTHKSIYIRAHTRMGWLQLVGSLKVQDSFAEYSLFYRGLLQKRTIILRSLLIVATPYLCILTNTYTHLITHIHASDGTGTNHSTRPAFSHTHKIYIHTHTHTHLYIHAHTYTHIYTHILAFGAAGTIDSTRRVFLHTHTHLYTHLYILTHTYTNVYTHIHA